MDELGPFFVRGPTLSRTVPFRSARIVIMGLVNAGGIPHANELQSQGAEGDLPVRSLIGVDRRRQKTDIAFETHHGARSKTERTEIGGERARILNGKRTDLGDFLRAG